MSRKIRSYGRYALILGASEGLGLAFAEQIAQSGTNLILVARRKNVLDDLGQKLSQDYGIEVETFAHDLADPETINKLAKQTQELEIGLVVYNAAVSFIGEFKNNSLQDQQRLIEVNVLSLLSALHVFALPMLTRNRGGFIIMSSLAGFQGSGFLSTYAASKAFSRVLGEGLWYEWKSQGVDIIACCAGATETPNFIKTNPEKANFFAPRVQKPYEVVVECFNQLGRKPSLITGRGNRVAHFIMSKLLPNKLAVKIMADNTKKMYRINS